MKKLSTKQLNEMNDWFVANMPNINSGGCGAFAYLFVQQFGGRIWRVDRTYDAKNNVALHGLEQITNNCKGNYNMSAAHFIVEQDGTFLDAMQILDVRGKGDEVIGEEVQFTSPSSWTYVITCEYTRAQMLTAVVEGQWNSKSKGDVKSIPSTFDSEVGFLAHLKVVWSCEVVPLIEDVKETSKLESVGHALVDALF